MSRAVCMEGDVFGCSSMYIATHARESNRCMSPSVFACARLREVGPRWHAVPYGGNTFWAFLLPVLRDSQVFGLPLPFAPLSRSDSHRPLPTLLPWLAPNNAGTRKAEVLTPDKNFLVPADTENKEMLLRLFADVMNGDGTNFEEVSAI